MRFHDQRAVAALRHWPQRECPLLSACRTLERTGGESVSSPKAVFFNWRDDVGWPSLKEVLECVTEKPPFQPMFKHVWLSLVGTLICATVVAAESLGPFVQVADIPLGQSTSRFDYQSFDPTSSRMFIAEMGSGRLLVFVSRSSEACRLDLMAFPKLRAFSTLHVPILHKVYASVPGNRRRAICFGCPGNEIGLSSGTGMLAILDLDLAEGDCQSACGRISRWHRLPVLTIRKSSYPMNLGSARHRGRCEE